MLPVEDRAHRPRLSAPQGRSDRQPNWPINHTSRYACSFDRPRVIGEADQCRPSTISEFSSIVRRKQYRCGRENSYFASNGFNIPLASYTTVNLRLGAIKDLWSVTAFARNLTDKRAQVSAINSAQDPDALLTIQPRTIGLTATRKF